MKDAVQAAAGRVGLELHSPIRRRKRPNLSPRMTDDGIGEEYFRPYPLSRYYSLWAVIADRVRRGGLRRILEIGCGNGRLGSLLIDQGVEQYTGLDFSPIFIKMARALEPGSRFVVEDARTSSIYTELQYDAIICTEVLEHIAEDLVVISRFPPGIRCLCTVPDFPAAGHVRHFRDSEQVARRYGRFFAKLDVAAFKGPTGTGVGVYFLFDGVRNESRV